MNYPRTSVHEDSLVTLLFWEKLPAPTREHRFWPGRRFRFDLAWPDRMVAVEVEGGTWISGHHTRGKGFEDDCTKLNEAACRGWTVLRITPSMIDDGRAIEWIRRALSRLRDVEDGAVA